MTALTLLPLIALSIFSPRVAFDECIELDVRTVAEHSPVVFLGTVTSIEISRASAFASETVAFEVERVWKGPVRRHFVIYNFRGAMTPTLFLNGAKYLVFAERHAERQRADFGLNASSPPTYGVSGCPGLARPYEHVKSDLSKLGKGRAPSSR